MVDIHGRGARDARPGMPTRLSQPQFRVAKVTDPPVVIVAGEIDLATVEELRESLDALDGRIVVDLAAVSFIDAAGLGVLAGTRKRLRSRRGDLRLRAPQDQVRRVLEVVGLDDWIIEE